MLSTKIPPRTFTIIHLPTVRKYSNNSTQTEQINFGSDSQYLKNAEVIKNLTSLTKKKSEQPDESSEPNDDIEPFTNILTGTLTNKTMSGYKSLKQFNDPSNFVPKLSHNLSRTLFSPGVHYLSDPRTNHFNFDRSLADIPHIDNLKMNKISNFTPSSRDTKLLDIANTLNKKHSKKQNNNEQSIKFFSSTSSMTSVLIKFHKYLSHNRPINTTLFSKFYPETTQFTTTSDVPTSLVVTAKDSSRNIYSIDADRSTDSEITLSVLGNALELMLTKPPKEFSKFLKNSKEEPKDDKSAYHYAKIGKFLVRSQLDAIDPRLPGTGTFDIKTRAVCAIRFDLAHTDYFPTNYEINRTYGLFESFERELFDAARIVMFKYSLQARLGNMDGIFMGFHNIKKFLGFQYLPLTEIDNIFFGDYSLDGKRYGNKLLKKPVNIDEQKQIDTLLDPESNSENSDSIDTIIDENDDISISNQLILKNIVNDFGNHHQTKREALSTFIANYELKISMSLLEKLVETIIEDTKGKPFRMIVKKLKNVNLGVPSSNTTTTTTSSTDGSSENKVEVGSNSSTSAEKNDLGCIVVVVTTLEKHELKELQMLSNEKIEQGNELVKNAQNNNGSLTPSERIKYFSKYVTDFRNKFFRLNRNILKNSVINDGFFAYKLTANHYFDGVKNDKDYPIPDIKILDKDSNYTWDVKYSIDKINRLSDKKYLYLKFIKNIAFTSFRDSDSESNIDVYTDDGDVQLDMNATPLQNITRAYSAKALKRKEFFNSNNNGDNNSK